MRQLLLTFFALFMLCVPALADDNLEFLQKQLQALEAGLPEILKEEADLDTQHDYVKRVLALREKIEALEAGEKQSEGFYYKLVAIESTVKQGEEKEGKATIGIEFDEETTTFKWVKDATADKHNYIETQSFGFEDYPKKIILGEPFTVKASAISQKDISPGYCWTTDEQKLINTLEISAGFGDSRVVQQNLYSISNCKNYKSSQTVHVGGRIDLEVHCESKEPKYFGLQGGYLYYEYKCKMTSSETPGQWRKIAGQPIKIYIKKHAYDKPMKNEDGSYILAPPKEGSEPSKIRYDISLGGTHEYLTHTTPIRLIYKPVYTKDEALENTSTVQHTVAVNNSIEQGESEDQDQGKDGDEDNQNQQQNGVSSSSADNTAQSSGRDNAEASGVDRAEAARLQKERKKHIKHWLKNAIPVENAQPGYSLTYDKWGRVQGKASNGTITLAKPDSAGLSPADYAWVRADTIDSLNLCTLKEYVERKLADKETASCQKSIPQQQAQTQTDPNSLPNFVGVEAAKAKADLKKLGVKVKWKAGSIVKNPAQQRLVEKQKPKAGSALKGVKQVELWVYRYVAKTVKVPKVVGMKFDEAAAKLKHEGLVASIGKTVFAKSPKQAGKVVSQSTKPGKKVFNGATVVLDISEGKNAKVPMPDIVGLTYEEAEQKMKGVGLRPRKKLGPYASNPEQPGTVADIGLAPVGTPITFGAPVAVTVYNTYSEKTAPKKQPEKIVKSDPASAFGGKPAPESPKATNTYWAGMWHVIGKYDMELHVSGHKVTGRYGDNMERTLEGEISGNVLTGWWREGKTYGRFKNTISDDGNSWSGNWNMMKETLGGWNGGWKGKRIGEKKPPEKTVKRDPASAFGGKKDPAPSPAGGNVVPQRMDCGGSIAGLREYPKKRVASEQHSEVGTKKNGRSTYPCWYKTSRGEGIFISGSFFPRQPIPPDNDKRYNFQSHCSNSKDYYKGVGMNGKAVRVQINPYTKDRLNSGQIRTLVNFHTNQMAKYAISCSGGDGDVASKPPPPSNTASNRLPERFKCDAGIPGVRLKNEKTSIMFDGVQGKVKHRGDIYSREGKLFTYRCQYFAKPGNRWNSKSLVLVTRVAHTSKGRENVCKSNSKYAQGKAVGIHMPIPDVLYTMRLKSLPTMEELLGKKDTEKLLKFHAEQAMPYAVSCK